MPYNCIFHILLHFYYINWLVKYADYHLAFRSFSLIERFLGTEPFRNVWTPKNRVRSIRRNCNELILDKIAIMKDLPQFQAGFSCDPSNLRRKYCAIGNFIEDKFIIISRSHGAPEKSSIGIKRDVRHGKPQVLETWITRDKINIRIALEVLI